MRSQLIIDCGLPQSFALCLPKRAEGSQFLWVAEVGFATPVVSYRIRRPWPVEVFCNPNRARFVCRFLQGRYDNG